MADSGLPALDAMIERLKMLAGERMPEAVAREAAPLIEAAIRKTAAAGTTPLGTPWPAKKDGGRALVHAAEHLSTTAQGRIVVTTLRGPDVFHHKGLGGKPRRQILPDGASIPPGVHEALLRAARTVFRRITRGQ